MSIIHPTGKLNEPFVFREAICRAAEVDGMAADDYEVSVFYRSGLHLSVPVV